MASYYKPMAFGYKFDDSRKAKFIEFLAEHPTAIGDACKHIGISRGTYERAMRADPEFRERVGAIWESTIDKVEEALLDRIRDKDTTAIIFYLKTKGKLRGYSEQPTQVINIGEKIDLSVVGGDDLEDDEIEDADIVSPDAIEEAKQENQ